MNFDDELLFRESKMVLQLRKTLQLRKSFSHQVQDQVHHILRYVKNSVQESCESTTSKIDYSCNQYIFKENKPDLFFVFLYYEKCLCC